MRILIADDERDILKILEQYFVGRGDTVTVATDGEQAWTIFQASPERFDSLLIDHRMPKMSGTDLVARLADNGFDVPVVMMSGDLHFSQNDLSLDGVFETIAKPMRLARLNEVFTKVETLLEPQ